MRLNSGGSRTRAYHMNCIAGFEKAAAFETSGGYTSPQMRTVREARLTTSLVMVVCCGIVGGTVVDSATGQARAGIQTVSGRVTRIPAFCGGKPLADRIDRPVVAVPYANKRFHVIKGSTDTPSRQIVLSFTSDSTGRFSFRVPAGVYAILVDEQVQPADASRYESRFVKMDRTCFAAWWAKPYYDLRVGNSNIEELNFEFTQRCFIDLDIPCLHYDGPLPQGEGSAVGAFRLACQP